MQEITSHKQIQEQALYNYRVLNSFLSSLPLSYIGNMKLHCVVNKHPAEALLVGRTNDCDDYQKRIKPWIINAFLKSPHLNN